MTLADAKTHMPGADAEYRAIYHQCRAALGLAVASAVAAGDRAALEAAAQRAGTYRALVECAALAGVDRGALEEALAEI